MILLVVIYNRLVVQYNSISIPSVDLRSYFKQPRANYYDDAVVQNTPLYANYTSLSLSIMVSVIAL